MRIARVMLALWASSLIAACSSMLPHGQAHTDRPWGSYEQARQAYVSIEPGRTTFAELRAAGLDPTAIPNVKLLSYSDLLRRLVPPTSDVRLDPGIRECLNAQRECEGFEVAENHVTHQRVGNFLMDFLDFRRETHTTGWNFDMVVLVARGRVVYKTWSGEPTVSQDSSTRNPLGPLQGLGASGLGRF